MITPGAGGGGGVRGGGGGWGTDGVGVMVMTSPGLPGGGVGPTTTDPSVPGTGTLGIVCALATLLITAHTLIIIPTFIE